MRIGFGYDVHRLQIGRKLILGGFDVPYQKGLTGHSDADVLVHSIIDAILGALGEGDIGGHFPDTDEKYKNISSLILLEKISSLMFAKGFKVGNIDATIAAEKPKLKEHINEMKKNIAKKLKCSEDKVNIKATTEEGLGFTGRMEGISSYAVVLLEKY